MIIAYVMKLNLEPALSKVDMATHKYGNKLDQKYAKNIYISNAVENEELDHHIIDHKCLKMNLRPKPAGQKRHMIA